MFQFHEAAQQKQEHTLESNFQQLRQDWCMSRVKSDRQSQEKP